VRRRVLAAMLAVTTLAVAAFGLPLAVAVKYLYRNQAVLRLEREVTVAATAVPDSYATSKDPVDLPRSGDGSRLALYRPDGTRFAGNGPARMDATARAALSGRVAQATGDPSIRIAVPVSSDERVVGVMRGELSDTAVDRRVHQVWLAMLGLGAGAIVVAGLVAWTQARRLSQPIDQLAVAAGRLGDGDFSVRASASGVAEIDEVSSTLNSTAERLGDLLARERAFSADASHQLRTPIAGLRLRLEAAKLDPSADREQAITNALGEVDRLETTIEDLLRLARDAPPTREPLDVAELVRDLDGTWREQLGGDGRSLRSIVAPDLPPVRASTPAVRQILEVLLGNAAEHGAGAVTIRARAAAGGLAVEVTDQGAGVVGDAERLFARRSGSTPGHGIGLALARSLAAAEGGRLVLANTGPAPSFTLLLPAETDGPT
jgi:signal transduction histidine kinase